MRHSSLPHILLVLGTFGTTVFAQRAEISVPVIERDAKTVVLKTRLENLTPGAEYRVGVGAVQETPKADLELLIGDQNTGAASSDFTQGYTAHWWEVDSLKVRGFVIEADEFAGDTLTLRFAIGKEEADKLGRLFVFISRKYGEDTWYLEDGVELNESHW